MKRDILCKGCCLKPIEVGPGEGTKSKLGRLKSACVCDLCNAPLQEGEVAVARSIWREPHGYHEWESSYLNGGQ